MLVNRFLIALFVAATLSFSVHAFNTSASKPDTIDFAGRSYNLAVRADDSRNDNSMDGIMYVDLLYVIPPQEGNYHNLRLWWRTDEWIFDLHDESCPLVHNTKEKQDFRIYSACDAISKLEWERRERGVDINNDFRFMENKQTGDIILVFWRLVAAHGEYFAELGFNRYINIPVPRYNDISSVLMMQYTVNIPGNDLDLTDPKERLLALLQADSPKWLEALEKIPVPQFFIDKGRDYLSCPDRAKDTGEDCP